MKLGDKIKMAREALGLNQSDLAERIGVEPATVSRWETGSVRPRTKKIRKIAEMLEKPVEWFQEPTMSAGEFEARLAALEKRATAAPSAMPGISIMQRLWPILQTADPAIQRACLYLCTGLEEDALEMEKTVREETKHLRAHLKVDRG